MAHRTNLRGQRELRRQWSAERERQPVLERQCLECQVCSPNRRSETKSFSSIILEEFSFLGPFSNRQAFFQFRSIFLKG